MEEKTFVEGMGKNAIHSDKHTIAGPNPSRKPPKPTKEIILESIEITTRTMVTIAELKEAIANYLTLDDIGEYTYEDNTPEILAVILGRLEMSLIRRKQELVIDQKALTEL